jgi:signal transduction histidine kinase
MMSGGLAAVTIAAMKRLDWALAAAVYPVGVVVSGLPAMDRSRCGIAIPVGLLIAYMVAARHDRRAALTGLALVLAGLVVLLFTDPLLDLGAVFVLPLCAGVWWAGRLVRSRERVAAELAERSRALEQVRGESARLAVEVDRAAIAADLDAAAREPLRAMVALADAGPAQAPEQAQATFGRIEREGRESLDELRQMLGKLRGDELETAPQPGLADLDELVVVERTGARRALPAGTELAGYRMVQHALAALEEPAVSLRYLPGAVELEVRGRLAAGGAAETALAAARERVTAHGGRFHRDRRPDGTCVVRGRLPAAGGA